MLSLRRMNPVDPESLRRQEPPLPHPQGDYRWVLCSRELIRQMMEGWSPTVELMVTKMDDTTLEFVARTHHCETNATKPGLRGSAPGAAGASAPAVDHKQ